MSRFGRILTEKGPRWAQEHDMEWALLDDAPWNGGGTTGERVRNPRSWLAPVSPSKIVGVAANYRDHAAEMGKPVPTVPKIFFKPPSSIIGPNAPIVIPPRTTRVDHEVELGVVIGLRCHRVSVTDAMDYVFGYTVVNDVSARDYQAFDGLFARAKGFDSFCPVGPYLVTGLDPRNLAMRCKVDGQLRQNSSTQEMVFGVAELIAFISDIMTLEPGDLIATGTPAGVGPLTAGQLVTVGIEGIGVLENPVDNRDDR